MFAIPVQLSPRMLYGAPDSLAPTPNKECLKSLGLGLPSTTIGGANEKATSPKSSAVLSPLSRAMQTHKSLFAMSPVVFPVYVGKQSAGRERRNQPVPTMISRKMLSFRQPCSLCARPVDVNSPVVLLPCAHIVHDECHDEMTLNQRYDRACGARMRSCARLPAAEFCAENARRSSTSCTPFAACGHGDRGSPVSSARYAKRRQTSPQMHNQ